MANLWALLDWKGKAHLYKLRWAILAHLRYGEHEDARRITEKLQCCEARLVALDNALSKICEEHGVDPEAARKIAESEPFALTNPNFVSDAEYQATIQATLIQLLEA
jgi:hypothetical protein